MTQGLQQASSDLEDAVESSMAMYAIPSLILPDNSQ